MWGHLDREGGGAGGQGGGGAARGMGEKQIEVDRRLANLSIDRCKRELEVVRKQRKTQRKERERLETPHAAIVGYTNAGKSSLLNILSGADVMAKDMLFATLDTTTRRIDLPDGQPLLITDTVGFVRNLPHRLVEAFKATLEEAVLADFLIHVLDATAPEIERFHDTTLEVLKELGAEDKEVITVLNKIDLVTDPEALRRARPQVSRSAARLRRSPARAWTPCSKPARKSWPTACAARTTASPSNARISSACSTARQRCSRRTTMAMISSSAPWFPPTIAGRLEAFANAPV